MNAYASKLIDLLNPTIIDLEDKLNELSTKKESLDEIGEMLSKVGDDVIKVGDYENQELIIRHLPNINTNEKEYRASCYLLKSVDKNIQSLPQYIESSNYIERLINYFKKQYDDLKDDVSELENICSEKKLNKKYLEIFSEEKPLVLDTLEFSDFLEKQKLTDEDKINLLIYTIQCNVDGYIKEKGVKGR